MNVIIAGMKRQVNDDKESVSSNIEENVNLEEDFFNDWEKFRYSLRIFSLIKWFFVEICI